MTAVSSPSERKRDAFTGVTLLAFAFAVWFYFIPFHAGGHGEHTILAQIASLLIGALSLLIIGLALLGIPTESAQASEEDPFLDIGGSIEPPALIVIAAVWGLFVPALSYLGFFISGALALVATFYLLDVRKPALVGALTAGALVSSYLIFELTFKLALPRGSLILKLFIYD